MTDLKKAADLALQATEEIQRWSEKILERIATRLRQELEAEGDVSIDYISYSFGASALSFPKWAGRFVGRSGTNWGGTGEPPEQGGFFMISFRPRPQGQRQPAILWGVLQNVKRRGGKFYTRRIYRELLETVNRHYGELLEAAGEKQEEVSKNVQTSHATGSVKFKSRDFFETLDSSEIEKVADEVTNYLAHLISG